MADSTKPVGEELVINVTADASKANKTIEDVSGKLKELADKETKVKIGADTSAFDKGIADVQKKLGNLANGKAPKIKLDVNADTSNAQKSIGKLTNRQGYVVIKVHADLDNVKKTLANIKLDKGLVFADADTDQRIRKVSEQLQLVHDLQALAAQHGGKINIDGNVVGQQALSKWESELSGFLKRVDEMSAKNRDKIYNDSIAKADKMYKAIQERAKEINTIPELAKDVASESSFDKKIAKQKKDIADLADFIKERNEELERIGAKKIPVRSYNTNKYAPSQDYATYAKADIEAKRLADAVKEYQKLAKIMEQLGNSFTERSSEINEHKYGRYANRAQETIARSRELEAMYGDIATRAGVGVIPKTSPYLNAEGKNNYSVYKSEYDNAKLVEQAAKDYEKVRDRLNKALYQSVTLGKEEYENLIKTGRAAETVLNMNNALPKNRIDLDRSHNDFLRDRIDYNATNWSKIPIQNYDAELSRLSRDKRTMYVEWKTTGDERYLKTLGNILVAERAVKEQQDAMNTALLTSDTIAGRFGQKLHSHLNWIAAGTFLGVAFSIPAAAIKSLVDTDEQLHNLGTVMRELEGGAAGEATTFQNFSDSMRTGIVTTLNEQADAMDRLAKQSEDNGTDEEAQRFRDLASSMRESAPVIKEQADEMERLAKQTEEAGKAHSSGQAQNMKRVSEEFKELAKVSHNYAISNKEVLDSARLWGRMYKDIDTVNVLVSQSAKLAVADNFSMEESTRAVEAAMFQFGMTARSAGEAVAYSNRIVDVYTKLSHNAGVSAQDLARGVERSGSVAHQAGISFEFLTALIAQGTRATALSGQEIGNMLKTAIGSFRSKKAVAELNKLGIAIKTVGEDGQEHFRSAQEILVEVATKAQTTNMDLQELWKQMSGGKFQWSKMAAMFSDYKEIIKNWGMAIQSQGFTDEQIKTQMDSISNRAKQLKNDLESIVINGGNSGISQFLKNLVTTLDRIVRLADYVGNSIVGSIGAFMAQAYALSYLWKNLKKFWGKIRDYKDVRKATGEAEERTKSDQADAKEKTDAKVEKTVDTSSSNTKAQSERNDANATNESTAANNNNAKSAEAEAGAKARAATTAQEKAGAESTDSASTSQNTSSTNANTGATNGNTGSKRANSSANMQNASTEGVDSAAKTQNTASTNANTTSKNVNTASTKAGTAANIASASSLTRLSISTRMFATATRGLSVATRGLRVALTGVRAVLMRINLTPELIAFTILTEIIANLAEKFDWFGDKQAEMAANQADYVASLEQQSQALDQEKDFVDSLLKAHEEFDNALANETEGTERYNQILENRGETERQVGNVVSEETLKYLEENNWSKESMNEVSKTHTEMINEKKKKIAEDIGSITEHAATTFTTAASNVKVYQAEKDAFLEGKELQLEGLSILQKAIIEFSRFLAGVFNWIGDKLAPTEAINRIKATIEKYPELAEGGNTILNALGIQKDISDFFYNRAKDAEGWGAKQYQDAIDGQLKDMRDAHNMMLRFNAKPPTIGGDVDYGGGGGGSKFGGGVKTAPNKPDVSLIPKEDSAKFSAIKSAVDQINSLAGQQLETLKAAQESWGATANNTMAIDNIYKNQQAQLKAQLKQLDSVEKDISEKANGLYDGSTKLTYTGGGSFIGAGSGNVNLNGGSPYLWDIANRASSMLSGRGVNINPAFLYGQMMHETTRGTDQTALKNNNLAGMGGGHEVPYDTIEDFLKIYVNTIANEPGIQNVTTAREFVHALKAGSYFEDDENLYATDVEGIINELGDAPGEMVSDIGAYIVQSANEKLTSGEIAKEWTGSLGDDVHGWCDDFTHYIYETVFNSLGRQNPLGSGVVNDKNFKSLGAYHPVGDGYVPQLGDLVDWAGHVGIYMGNGKYLARNTSGVHIGDISEGEGYGFGAFHGYGSIAEATGSSGMVTPRTIIIPDLKGLEVSQEEWNNLDINGKRELVNSKKDKIANGEALLKALDEANQMEMYRQQLALKAMKLERERIKALIENTKKEVEYVVQNMEYANNAYLTEKGLNATSSLKDSLKANVLERRLKEMESRAVRFTKGTLGDKEWADAMNKVRMELDQTKEAFINASYTEDKEAYERRAKRRNATAMRGQGAWDSYNIRQGFSIRDAEAEIERLTRKLDQLRHDTTTKDIKAIEETENALLEAKKKLLDVQQDYNKKVIKGWYDLTDQILMKGKTFEDVLADLWRQLGEDALKLLFHQDIGEGSFFSKLLGYGKPKEAQNTYNAGLDANALGMDANKILDNSNRISGGYSFDQFRQLNYNQYAPFDSFSFLMGKIAGASGNTTPTIDQKKYENDKAYLTKNGFSAENADLELLKVAGYKDYFKHRYENDIKYLMNNGYSKADATKQIDAMPVYKELKKILAEEDAKKKADQRQSNDTKNKNTDALTQTNNALVDNTQATKELTNAVNNATNGTMGVGAGNGTETNTGVSGNVAKEEETTIADLAKDNGNFTSLEQFNEKSKAPANANNNSPYSFNSNQFDIANQVGKLHDALDRSTLITSKNTEANVKNTEGVDKSTSTVAGTATKIGGWLGALGGLIGGKAGKTVSILGGIASAFGLFGGGGKSNGGILGFANGGLPAGRINGAGTGRSDSILAYLANKGQFVMLSNGEYVINEKSAKALGYDTLDSLNHYADGGSINPTPYVPTITPSVQSKALAYTASGNYGAQTTDLLRQQNTQMREQTKLMRGMGQGQGGSSVVVLNTHASSDDVIRALNENPRAVQAILGRQERMGFR